MLDPKLLKAKPNLVKKALRARELSPNLVDEWLKTDKQYKGLKLQVDKLRHQRNIISEQINELKKQGKADEANKKIREAKAMVKKIKRIEEKTTELEKQLKELTLQFPNLASTALKKEQIIERFGKPKKYGWQRNYLELGKELHLINFESAVKMAGEGFYVLTDRGAMLERALINFCLDSAIEMGYKEQLIPILLNEKAVLASGHLPKFKEGMYRTLEGFYLSPTEEVSLLNLYAGQILKAEQLPINLVAYMPSFRTEKGATKGILRAHQFDEVELFKFTKQEESEKELQKMVKDATTILKKLKLPYRVKLLPASDIATAAYMTYDVDVYSPRSGWLEVSSCSNCTDFQARRAKIFYLEKGEKKLVHTLNGTALGLNRTWVAVLENYQQKDGSVKIPLALQKYVGMKKIEA